MTASLFLSLIFVLFSLVIDGSSFHVENCPIESNGCSCGILSSELSCTGAQTGYSLKNTLTSIEPSKSVQIFSMYRTSIEEIRDYTFSQLKVTNEMRLFDNKELESIQPNAFYGSELTIKRLDLHNCSLSGSSLFQAISKLVNLEELNLGQNKILDVPYYAFGQQDRLKSINLANNRIQVIGESAFRQLTHLSFLRLEHNEITSLDEDSFAINKPATANLVGQPSHATIKRIPSSDVIDVNMKFNQVSFVHENAFRSLGRPIRLNLDGNDLREYKKRAFDQVMTFEQSQISFRLNKNIACDDCDLLRVIQNQTYMHKLKHLRCADKSNRYLWYLTAADFPSSCQV